MEEAKIFDWFEKLYKEIQELKRPPYVGEGHVKNQELNMALAAAQSEYTVARRSQRNHFLRVPYEDLDDLMAASRPYLSKNGLSVTFPVSHTSDGGTVLSCILLHSSGQSIESSVRLLPIKNDPKTFASEFSFMKRILYSGITGVVASDEDDDADKAMQEYRDADVKGTALNSRKDPRDDKEPITPEQYEELEYELTDYPDIAEQIINALQIRDLASMPKSKYHSAMERVRTIKDARNRKR